MIASSAFPLVTLMIGLAISVPDRPMAPIFGGYWGLAALAGFALTFLLYWVVLHLSDVRAFVATGVLSVLALEALAWVLGIMVHRDYFTLSFTHIAVWFMLLLHWLNTRHSGALRKETKRDLGRVFMVFFLLMIVWIMMMGYAIATRNEPRPIEALVYNSYNALVAFAIFILSRMLVAATYRTVAISPSAIRVDDAHLDKLLGEGEQAILRAFVDSDDMRLTCADIEARSRAAGKADSPKDAAPCSACSPEDAKATACPKYRSTYNKMLALKKVLEFAEIGTILPPKNKMNVLVEGWKLAIFTDVRIRRSRDKPD